MKNIKRINSIVRTEAFALVGLLAILLLLYGYFFLEYHIKWSLEKSAYQSIGSEVNISDLEIDFKKPAVKITRIQITNPDKPMQNIIEISNVLVDFEYSPLFSGSFVSEITSVIGLQFHTDRSRAGRVMPKDKRILVVKDPSQNKVHKMLEDKFKKTAFSDLASLFDKDKRKEVENAYKNKLSSIKASKAVEQETKAIKAKVKAVEDYAKSKEVKALLAEVKNFKFESGTAGLIASAGKALKLSKKIKSTRSKIKNDLAEIKSEAKSLKSRIKNSPKDFLSDIGDLKTALDPKQLSSEKITEEVLSEYFSLQLSQVTRVTGALKKDALGKSADYVDAVAPPKKEVDPDKISQMNLEKEKERKYAEVGRNIIFYRAALLPKYHFKKINIFSEAQEGQDLGDVQGTVLNLTDAPELVGKPMIVKINGSVPKQNIGSFRLDANIDHTNLDKKTEVVEVELTDYLIKGLELFDGSDEWIKVVKSNTATNLKATLSEGKINLKLSQLLKSPEYDTFAKEKYAKILMQKFKQQAPELKLNLSAVGEMSSPKLKISSNLGKVIKDIVTDSLKDSVNSMAKEQLSKLDSKALEKLSPYIKDLDVSSLKAGDLGKVLDKEISKGLDKLKAKSGKKDIKKDLLKKLFKKF